MNAPATFPADINHSFVTYIDVYTVSQLYIKWTNLTNEVEHK